MNFDLKLLDLHWINNEDSPSDLCAHGQVFVQIGNEVIADKNSLHIAVSSTALYLMRTIKDDYKKEAYTAYEKPRFFLL